jgi:hypothetical protein
MRSTRGDKFEIALDLDAGPLRNMRRENESTRTAAGSWTKKEGMKVVALIAFKDAF